jgi:drug/metabolite transporter (DMT)-like permease
MLSGTNIVYSAILTVLYLKQKIYRHHYLGIFLITLGVILVGVACLLDHNHDDDLDKKGVGDLIAGIALLQFGIFMGAAGFIIEEKFIRTVYGLDPILIVGCEGSSACVMWIVILTIF